MIFTEIGRHISNMPKKSFGNLRPVSNLILLVVWVITEGTDILDETQ